MGWKDFKMIAWNSIESGFHSENIQELVGRNHLVMDKSSYKNDYGVLICGIKGK